MALVIPAILVLVGGAIAIHYEALSLGSRWMARTSLRPRLVVVWGLVSALIAHVLEVWWFGLGYSILLRFPGVGGLHGEFDGTWTDCNYFSFAAYTSLGFGDITPDGPVRLLAGMEALTGLVLIAWTASFMFLQLQANWREPE